jgi:hypothetical protein
MKDILKVWTTTSSGKVTVNMKKLTILTHELVGSCICDILWRTNGRKQSSSFSMEFKAESEMRLWASKMTENRRRAILKANAE